MAKMYHFTFVILVTLLSAEVLGLQGKNKSEKDQNFKANKPSQGIQITAWGLIAIILGIIFCGAAIYYSIVCNHVLCQRERLYDRIELSPI